MKPSKGSIVIYHQPDSEPAHNGQREHPAMVNTVFFNMGGPNAHGINCTVFPDLGPVQHQTSVLHRNAAAVGGMWWDWPQYEGE